MAMITCPECGKEISSNAAQCPGCGFVLKKKKKGGFLKVILIIIGVIVVLFIALAAFATSQAGISDWGFNEETNKKIDINGTVISIPDYYKESDDSNASSEAVYSFVANEGLADKAQLSIAVMDTVLTIMPSADDVRKIADTSDSNRTVSESRTIDLLTGKGWVFDITGDEYKGKAAYFFRIGDKPLIVLNIWANNTRYENYESDFNKIIEEIQWFALPNITVSKNAENTGSFEDFKKMMDSYEAFFDQYVEFMASYTKASNPISMLTEYTEMMAQYAETMAAMEGVDQSSLSEKELAYYIEVTARIEQKLLGVMTQ